MRLGLDYAWATISPAAHKAVGSSFACRYLSHDPTKDLSPAEAQTLHSGGIDVVVVWETAATRALGGNAAGKQDAWDAVAAATRCGMPTGRPIYFAVDFDETPAQAPTVADYFRGVNSVLGVTRTGAYGGFWSVKRLFDAGLIHYGWQTYAWSGGNLDKRAQLYQFSNGHRVAGVGVDYNHALAADFGQWSYAFTPPPPPPGPTGIAHFAGTYDTATGEWTVQGTPGTFKPGPPQRWASVEVQFNPSDGTWRCVPLPWDASPLGGS